MSIRLITEGSEWPGYNLIIKLKEMVGGLSVKLPNCIKLPANYTNAKLFSLSRESMMRTNYLPFLI